MTIQLFEQFPSLASLPHVSLGRFPTPLEPLEGLSREWSQPGLLVKREDLSGEQYGGNKVRKLEFILGEAQKRGITRLISVGGIGSNHMLATALYGKQLGFPVSGILVRQPVTAEVQQNLRAYAALGLECVLSSYPLVPARIAGVWTRSRLRGEKPMLVPAGGSSATGTIGWVNAALELNYQLREQALQIPERIYVPLGSGGTVAGLVLGAALCGLKTQIVGVRVVSRMLTNRNTVVALCRGTWKRLLAADPTLPPFPTIDEARLKIIGDQFGRGYGHPTEAGKEACTEIQKSDALKLEWTYTGKTLAGMKADLEQRPMQRPGVFWNTYSSSDLSRLTRDIGPGKLPASLRPFLEPTALQFGS